MTHTPRFASVDDVRERLAAHGYLASDAIATTVFLADQLGKPLLVEGPAGVGKTALSAAVAAATEGQLVRLQCYEGVDEARALYEWNHAKQLLRITAGKDESWDEAKTEKKMGKRVTGLVVGWRIRSSVLDAIVDDRATKHSFWA